MMRSCFLFLLLLTGSAQPELYDDQQVSNQSFVEMPGGNTSTSEQLKLYDDQQVNQSFVEMQGNTSRSEEPKWQHVQPEVSNNFVIDIETTKKSCSYQALLKYLNLTKNNELYSLSRPAKSFERTTIVLLKMVLYAILDVRENDQTFIPYVWIYMQWENDHIKWEPDNFCGLKQIMVPTELLWKPDLTIEEMIEKDKAPPSPYLTIKFDGHVEMRNDQVLISTCRMQVYKFPFDIQMCNLSFKSVVYSTQELKFHAITNSSKIAGWSDRMMGKHYEWLLINETVDTTFVTSFEYNQSMIVYTITMRRKSALYIVNFILPVLFFLCLDFASFLISDGGGEKLGFKITVLLAVTVMQLILNEILPSSSDRIPLIAVYCSGIFALMMLSLLETIVVMHLLDKESAAQDNEADKDQCLTEDCVERQRTSNFHHCFRETKKWTCCKCACDAGKTPAEALPDKEDSSNRLMEGSHALEKLSDDLREKAKTMTVMRSSSRKEERKPGYWTKLTKKINKVFFICYLIATILFLILIFLLWNIAEDN